MTVLTGLQMTDKQLDKHLKRLIPKLRKFSGSDSAFERLVKHYTKNGATITTDAHRLLKVYQTIENELTVENDTVFNQIDRITQIKEDFLYKIELSYKEVDELRHIARLNSKIFESTDIIIKPTDSGTLQATIENRRFKTDYSTSQLNLSYKVNQIECYDDNKNTDMRKISVNSKYLADVLDFVYDTKQSSVSLHIPSNKLAPLLFSGNHYEYILLPLRPN